MYDPPGYLWAIANAGITAIPALTGRRGSSTRSASPIWSLP